MIHKFFFKIGQKIRNPSLDRIYKFLKVSEKWELDALENYQLKKLNELLYFANKNSPFYRKKFENINLDIKSLNDISRIPILNKVELLEYSKDIQSKAKFKNLKKAISSGTSGNSLFFLRDEFADSFNRASTFRGYSWYNILAWERNGYFWGFNFSFLNKIKTFFLDFTQNRFRLFSYGNQDISRFVNKIQKAKYIHGYSSMIYETAKFINKNNLKKPTKLKLVKGTSEKIFDAYQTEVKKAFGSKIVSEYGATESGIIAFECTKENMHINMEGCIVEEIDNEILVTNLQMKSFPVIRYKLGDYIKLSSEKCTCGKNHKIIEYVNGRIGKSIYGITKKYPSLTFYYIFKNLEKQNIFLSYQIIQNKIGELNIYIEQFLSQEKKILLEKEIFKYFNKDITFKIIHNESIKMINKKRVDFISNITRE